MPDGKHAGRATAELPGIHLNWMAHRGVARGEPGQLRALTHEIDGNGRPPLLDLLRTATPARRNARTPADQRGRM